MGDCPGVVPEMEYSAAMDVTLPSEYLAPVDTSNSEQPSTLMMTPVTDTPSSNDAREYRYATMLSLMTEKSAENRTGSQQQPVKLISGTNPLSALLGKDLKHAIVTNSCSFRTPDPVCHAAATVKRTGSGSQNCDWEGSYRSRGVSAARLRFMSEMGCFSFPPAAQRLQLLEIYFNHVHPVLPVIDRREFLSSYFGSDNPPPLILQQAVFLAASRYMTGDGGSINGIPEIRSHCDELHTKVRLLVDVEIVHERLAVIQASLIASLHWEGREGLNSALDSLSLAVRAGQEMGFHRQKGPSPQSENSEQEKLHRRIWWCTYTLDRFCAAQEGTPFIINERDCDVEPLTQDDLAGEDRITTEVGLINLSMARVIEDTVRCLYQPSDGFTLLSPSGVSVRQRLLAQLDTIDDRIRISLLSGLQASEALQAGASDLSVSFGAFLSTQYVHLTETMPTTNSTNSSFSLDAIRILVHRPFLLYSEPPGSGVHLSRDLCRDNAKNIIARLNLLLEPDMLRYSWPFTVYAVVNCLLIFWYDVSSPATTDENTLQKARAAYLDVVNLLRVMGHTWWAAAAKHKLALALAQAVMVFNSQGRPTGATGRAHQEPSSSVSSPISTATANRPSNAEYDANSVSFTSDASALPINWDMTGQGYIFSGYNSMEYWSSLGLDFDVDVAANLFSIDLL